MAKSDYENFLERHITDLEFKISELQSSHRDLEDQLRKTTRLRVDAEIRAANWQRRVWELSEKEEPPDDVMSATVFALEGDRALMSFEDRDGRQHMGWVLRTLLPPDLHVNDLLQVRVFLKGRETRLEWRHLTPPEPAAYLEAYERLPVLDVDCE